MILTVLLTLAVIVAGVSLGGATTGTDRAATRQATSIDSCTTIDEPGTYRLTASIENSTAPICIDIRASDVHFDGGGHTIDGNITPPMQLAAYQESPPNRGIGVGINFDEPARLSNVTVTDVAVTDWMGGVVARDVFESTIRNVRSVTNGLGVVLESAPGATVVNTTASDNGPIGVLLLNSPGSTVRGVTANGNLHTGIELTNSSESTVRTVTATENGFRGLGLEDEPIGTVVENVTVADSDFSRNGYAGMVVFLVTNSTFANNSVAWTKGTLPPGSSPPVPSAGIIVDGGFRNSFTDTDARNQAAWAYLGVNNRKPNTVENLRTDAVPVTFVGQNVALGPTATVPPDAGNGPNLHLLAGGLVVTRTSANALIDLQVSWGTMESGDQPTNETSTVGESP